MYIRKSSTKWIPYHLNKLGFNSYQEYLNSEHWIELRKKFYNSKLFNGSCYCCGDDKGKFNLHHKTYKRFGNEKLDDLIAVCEDCHKEIHELLNHNNNSRINIWNVSKKIRSRHKKQRKIQLFFKHKINTSVKEASRLAANINNCAGSSSDSQSQSQIKS